MSAATPHSRTERTLESLDPAMVEILRTMTPAERLAIGNGMWRSARDMIRNLFRAQHPEWSIEQVHQAAARRLLDGAH